MPADGFPLTLLPTCGKSWPVPLPSAPPTASTSAQARVTVLMPTYNAERYLDESIGSLQAQTFKDWELLAIDDGSTDGSLQVLERLAATDARIHVLRNPHNMGLSRTRNRALDEARGEFVAWLDADDIALPTRLEKQVGFFEDHPKFGMVGSWVEEIDSNGASNGHRWILNAPAACIPATMLFRCYCAQSAMMLRRSEVGDERYDELFPPSEDYEFNARLARRLPMWNLPEVLCLYRRHAASTSTVQSPQAIATMRELVRAQLALLDIVPTEEEMDRHNNLANRNLRDRANLPQAEEWLRRLLHANARRQAFEPVAFARVMVTHWFYVCQAGEGPLVSRLRTFVRGNLVREACLPLGQWVGFVLGTIQKAWQMWCARSAVACGPSRFERSQMENTLSTP